MARKKGTANISAIAATHVKASQPDDVTTSLSGNVVDRDDFDRAMAEADEVNETDVKYTTASKPAKGSKMLPHASLYMHRHVHRALRQRALDRDVKLQVILREAMQEYLDRHNFNLDIETGNRTKKQADER